MDALKVYDVRKICDARLYIVDMVAAFVRALATVLLMGRVAVLYRYCAVPVALLCAQGRRPASPAALCTRGRRPARSPSTPRAFGSARRLKKEVPQRPVALRDFVPWHAAMPRGSVMMSRAAARRRFIKILLKVSDGYDLSLMGDRALSTHWSVILSIAPIQKSPGPNGPGDSPSGWRDLNPRPLRPERSALPSCATPRCPMSIAIPRRKTQTEIGGQWEVCATPQR